MGRTAGQMTMGRMLASAAVRYGDAPAFICTASGRRLGFRAFRARADALGRAFRARGLVKGDVVAFLGGNRLEMAEIYYAIACAGLVGLPLSPRSTPAELEGALAQAEARLVLLDGRFGDRLRRDRPAIAFGASDDAYEAMIADAPAEPLPDDDVDEHDPFFYSMTSGTTGGPKSYLLSHYNNATVAPMVRALDLTRNDVVLTVFPLAGRVGFGWTVASLFLGAANILVDFEPETVLRVIAAERATVVNLVPTMGTMLLSALDRAPQDLSSLRAVIFAGAHLPEGLMAAASARLCPAIYEFYGMNEMGALCVSGPADRRARPGSVGRPILFAEVKVVTPEGRSAGVEEVGEVLGRSPMATNAYCGDPEASAATFRDGWVHTGDLGCVDEAGFLFLRGRKKDMIVSGGQNVYAAEVENVLAGMPGIAECAVIGLPDPLWGERVVAVIVPAADGAPDAAALEAHCRERLAGYKVPKAFLFDSGPLPRTATAKVQKFRLVERFASAPPREEARCG